MAAKQKELEGVGRKEIKEVEEAAEAYVAARDTRMTWTKEEVKTKKALTDLMHKHGIPSYEYEVEIEGDDGKETIERVAELKVTEKLKVRKKGADDAEEDEPEAE